MPDVLRQRTKNLDTVLMPLELLRRIPRNRLITASELQEQLKQGGVSGICVRYNANLKP